MIHQFPLSKQKELTPAQTKEILEKLISQVNFNIEWVSDDEFYLESVSLTHDAAELEQWASANKISGRKISDAVDTIISATREVNDKIGGKEAVLREELLKAFDAVMPEDKFRVPFTKLGGEDLAEKMKSKVSDFSPEVQAEILGIVRRGQDHITMTTKLSKLIEKEGVPGNTKEHLAILREAYDIVLHEKP